MKSLHHVLTIAWLLPMAIIADDGYGPTGAQHHPPTYHPPAGLVKGAAFIDRILPIPVANGLRSDTWGGANVKPRNVENGLEDPAWSYWCSSVHREPDGIYHMFVTRWPEDDPRGHNAWPQSRVVHATGTSPTGPFVFKKEIDKGHNVMCYRAKDGTYVLYVINGAYTAKSVDGPWAKYDLKYDLRGMPEVPMSNHTFTRREDGSVLMVSRGGHIWISEDGLKPFRKITSVSLYPKIKGEFEDPVVWRDDVQYHLIVNDWKGRTAFYLRSPDGVNWTWDEGKAYDIAVVRHPDGTKEGWHKLERPNVLQDDHKRATHLYLAAMDAPKDLDRGSDGHSSKVVALPLTVERRLEFISAPDKNAETSKVQLKIAAEPGFDPAAIDTTSLRFGPSLEVNFGKGARVIESSISEGAMTLTFDSLTTKTPEFDPVYKLLGSTKTGELVLGYIRSPDHPGLRPILSPEAPQLAEPGTLAVTVENFGLKASATTTLKVKLSGRGLEPSTHSASVPALKPYESIRISLKIDPAITPGKDIKIETTVGEPDAASAITTKL